MKDAIIRAEALRFSYTSAEGVAPVVLDGVDPVSYTHLPSVNEKGGEIPPFLWRKGEERSGFFPKQRARVVFFLRL